MRFTCVHKCSPRRQSPLPHRRMAMLLVWLRWRPWALACKCSPRRQGTHGHLMAMLLVWLRGELWDQHGAPLALPLGLGCAGNCGFVLVPLAHPKIVSEIVDWCWRPADVASCRACVGTRVVPCQWGLRSCPTRGWWCLVRRCALPLPRYCLAGARHSDGERKPLAND